MKISSLLPVSADLPITMPDGSESGITLKVIGQDSKPFRDVAKRYAQQMIGTSEKPNIEHLEKQNVELTAACVVGWSGLDDDQGEPLPFSKEKALELFGMPELSFVREQVEAFVSKRAHFFRRSEVSS